MERAEYGKHFELERGHWWFRGRRAAAFGILGRAAAAGARTDRILDAGCGTGINLAELGKRGTAFGCDLSEDALDFCRQRGLARLARADVRRLPYRPASFDLVTLFDVLYHKEIPDDAEVLRGIRDVLRDGGLFLMTDSALKSLRGPHDAAMRGARRYDRKTLRAKLEAAGFEVVRLTYFFFLTFPAVYAKRRLGRWRAARHPDEAPRSDLAQAPRFVNAALAFLLKGEAAWAARRNLPIGSSILALARKKGTP